MADLAYVVAVISPERVIRDAITSAMEDNPHAASVWTLSEYPAPGQLAQIREAAGGCVVFLDFTDTLRARAIAAELDRYYPTAATIAVHVGSRKQDLLEFMQLGIRELLALPMVAGDIIRACDRAARKLRKETDEGAPGGSMYAFLPARAGAGSTTIAVHSAAAAARLSTQPLLLIDFDLHLGMTSFLFKLHSEQSVLDALTFKGQWESSAWERMLNRRDRLEILGSAPFEFGHTAPESGAASVLDYALQRYRTICVDLPGEMREHELATMQRAREIFLVCTSDLGTLHMAKRKADFLQALEIHPRVSVIMNHSDERGSMPVKDVEDILGLPVRFTVPTAEREIAEATRTAGAIEGHSGIAKQLERIARRMLGTSGEVEDEPQSRKFIDFFSVTPIREKAGWKT
jgi:Flp pilus assembly CpaE family ATPase